MAAGAWFPTQTTREKILRGTFDWDSDAFKCALFTSSSNIGPTSAAYSALTSQHANANGYVTGGVTVSFILNGTRSVSASFANNPVWSALGGPITAAFACIYEVGGDVALFHMLDRTSTNVAAATFGTPTGDNVTLTSPAQFPVIPAGTLFEVSGHAWPGNNGLYVATGTPTSSSLPATKLTGSSPSVATASGVAVHTAASVTAADGSLLMIDSDGTPNPVFLLA